MWFAIDYDGTFAADPELFVRWVAVLAARGHHCVMVTGRADTPPWGDELRAAVGDLMPIVFAAGGWKRQAAERAGYAIDIWIDDHPEYIGPQSDREALALRRASEP